MADIKVFCLHCGQHIECDESYGGLQINCPTCGKSFALPQSTQSVTTAQPPARITPQSVSERKTVGGDEQLPEGWKTSQSKKDSDHGVSGGKKQGMAITSMVLGIISLLTCYLAALPGILAIIFGHIARGKVKESPEKYTGKGMATAGCVMGYVGVVIGLAAIPIGLFVVVPNFVKAKATAQANACINNLRQIDAAANQFALEKGKRTGDPINLSVDLTPYIKLDSTWKIPPCPAGGVYHISQVGEPPTCSIGHTVTPAHEIP